MKRITQSLLTLALVAGLVGLYIPQAYSVIQNLTVFDSAGKNIGRQTVTIVFPAGVTNADGDTEVEEETDDDGVLYYDFPGDGDYIIKFPGGQMTYVVEGGIPTYIKVGGALLGATAIWYAADDDDNGGNNGNGGDNGGTNGGDNGGTNGGDNGGTNGGDNGGTNGGDNGGTNGGDNGGTNGGDNGGTNGGDNGGTNGGDNGGTNGGDNGGTNGGQADPNGDYDVLSFFIIENESNHPEGPLRDALYTFMKDRDNNTVTVTIVGPGVSATLTGTCDDDGNFTVSGDGTFSGFSTTLSMEGNIDGEAGTLDTEVSAGDDGALPGGDPIVADVEAERVI